MNQTAVNASSTTEPTSPSVRLTQFPTLANGTDARRWERVDRESKARALREVIRARQERAFHFATGLFGDPAWEILLSLYACELSDRRITISGVILGSAIPYTTGLRWIKILVDEELITRRKDPLNGKRFFIELTVNGRNTMSDYLRSLPCGVLPL